MKLPVLWINLRRRSDRREWFEWANVRKWPGLGWRRVDGVDPWEGGFKRVDPGGRVSTDGQLGCWLSHWMCWQVVVASGWKAAVVMEDDALLLADPGPVLEGRKGLVVMGREPFKTWAYQVDQETARVLVDRLKYPRANIDHDWWGLEWTSGVCVPPLAMHMDNRFMSDTCRFGQGVMAGIVREGRAP